MQTLLPILSWLSDHQLYAWIGLSLIVNLALRARTPEQWIAWCETKPRLVGVIRLLRAVGIDPAKAIEAIKTIVNGKARVDPFAAVLAAPKPMTPDELADEVLKRLDVIPPAPKVPTIVERDTEPGKPPAA